MVLKHPQYLQNNTNHINQPIKIKFLTKKLYTGYKNIYKFRVSSTIFGKHLVYQVHPEQIVKVNKILRNLIGCLEGWKLENCLTLCRHRGLNPEPLVRSAVV